MLECQRVLSSYFSSVELLASARSPSDAVVVESDGAPVSVDVADGAAFAEGSEGSGCAGVDSAGGAGGADDTGDPEGGVGTKGSEDIGGTEGADAEPFICATVKACRAARRSRLRS